MKQYLVATIQALSQPEINALIDPDVLARLKQNDPNPEIRVYSIGHTGESNLHLPGIGQKTFTWIQAAVQWLVDRLPIGTSVFNRHDPNSNSHSGREQIGEVVGKAVKHIGDRLNALAAIYIQPQFRSRPLDVASVEAEIEYAHDGLQAWPTAVNNVSGVALSNSGIDTPGFPGATLLGAVQAYVQAFAGESFGGTTMNLSEVRQAIKEQGWSPAQIFSMSDITGDARVAAELDTKAKEKYQDTLNANERLKKERDDAVQKLGTFEKRVETRTKSTSVLEAELASPDRKLSDKAKLYIKRKAAEFTTEAADEESLKKDVGTFVEKANQEYNELAKDIFGVAEGQSDEGGQAGAGQNAGLTIPPEFMVGGGGAGAGKPAGNPPPDFGDAAKRGLAAEMNPDINPLIPGGKAAKDALKT